MAKDKTFGEAAKEKYDELLRVIVMRKEEITALEKEVKPLKNYLQTIGLMGSPKRRGRKARGEKQEG